MIKNVCIGLCGGDYVSRRNWEEWDSETYMLLI